jgi:hypothetical protein
MTWRDDGANSRARSGKSEMRQEDKVVVQGEDAKHREDEASQTFVLCVLKLLECVQVRGYA